MPLTPYQRVRVLTVGGVLACWLFIAFASSMMGIPATRGFEISLVQQPSPFAAFLGVGVVLVLAVLIGTVIAGTIRFEAGLFAATLGLAAVSVRGGTMGSVLRAAHGPSIFVQLIVELILLYVFVLAGWWILNLLHRRGLLLHDTHRDGVPDGKSTPQQRIQTTAVAALVMIILMLFLAQADAKNQVLAAVFFSALLGAYVSHIFHPTSGGIYYWLAPLVVGVIGYLLAAASPGGWNIGQINGYFGALARPVPLDYASVGPAGAVLGYWMARNSRRAENSEASVAV